MKLAFKKYSFLIIFIGLFLVGGHQEVQAASLPYTIDQAPLDPPNISDYTVIEISNVNELVTSLADNNTTKVIYQLENDIQLTKTTNINGDKAINLNGHTLSATNNGYLYVSKSNSCSQFKLYNGHLSGGPNSKKTGNYSASGTAFFQLNYLAQVDVAFEDVDYESPEKGGNFFIGLSANVFCLGNVNVKTYGTNIRAANMTFLGDFTGEAYGNGASGDYGEGSGGVNLSFDGYNWGLRNPYNRYAKDSEPMSQTVGDRRLYIAPDSHVVLNNRNENSPGGYTNNIANFSTLTVDGSLIAKAAGTSLRTTASETNENTSGVDSYLNQAGTYNGQANININEGATFEISSTNIDGKYGALYTYNTNFYSYKPKNFDMRYFGTGLFFWSWNTPPYSNMYLYGLDIGVWDKVQQGIGDPNLSWSNVESLSVVGFWTNIFGISNLGKVSSSNKDLEKSFSIGDYSRISNNISIPKTIVDKQFINNDNDVFLDNGSTTFSGSSGYTNPSGIIPDKVAVDAEVTLKIDSMQYTTKTDDSGKWTFSNLDLSKVKGGTIGTLNLTDTDLRTSPEINVLIKDTIPPVATPKLQLIELGDTAALQDPKAGIGSASDETSPTDKLTYEFVTSEEARQQMITQLGVYSVDIKVSDEAGNATTVTSPVIVYPKGEKITNGYIVGNDFRTDYDTWNKASDEEKRNLMIKEGSIKGYDVDLNNNTVTDVTDDPTKMIIDFSDIAWEPNQTYPIIVKVNSYKKTINVTLVPSTVKMTIKQVYENTDDAIYSNLENKTPVDNNKSIEVECESDIATVLNKQISDGNMVLNYDGYSTQAISDYKVYQKGVEITPTPTKVPNEDFTVVYSYQGQLKFQDVAEKIDFGTIDITGSSSDTPLSESSDQSISIINTIQNASWKLKASLPDGIKQSDNKPFLGNIVYKNENGIEQIINTSSTEIQKQTDQSLYSQLQLKNKNSGLYLHQDAGNLRGSYAGRMVWTLEDTP